MQIKKKKKAMTLIELLVSLFIVAIMTGVALPMFSSYQKRNTLDSDARSIAAIFAYARALQNNPDILSRTSSSSRNFQIKINPSEGKITISPESDESYIIDQFNIGPGEVMTVSATTGLSSESDNLTITLSGQPPVEKITCGPNPVVDCSQTLSITLSLENNPSISKMVFITNTFENKLFSVSII